MSWLHLAALLGSGALAALGTRGIMALAPRVGLVSRPSGERWSTRAVPLGGGVAIALVALPALAWLSLDLALAALAMLALGLIDDRRSLSPRVKLAVQAAAAAWLVAGPLDPGPAPLLRVPWAAAPLTAAWLIGMTNAVNLLDHVDGSAGGVCGVAAATLYLLAAGGEAPQPAVALAALAVAGACAGFLGFNAPPARVFMGDAGSLLLGLALAGLTLRLPATGSPLRDAALPALVLAIPLFDTALVWFSRRAARRPFLLGGRDHTSHRLIALGLSERRTVVCLWGVAAGIGGVALAVARADVGVAVTTCVLGGVLLIFLGLFLGEVPVYKAGARPTLRPAPWRFALELGIDAALLTAAWLAAYGLRFEGLAMPDTGLPALPFYLRATALPALPVVLGFKLSALAAAGLYRGIWRTIGLRDVVAIARALGVATLLLVLTATLLDRFEHYSRGVIVIDWLLAFAGVIGARSALRLLREGVGTLADRPQRAGLVAPAALRPLVDEALGRGAPWAVVTQISPDEDPAAVVAALQAAEAELALLALPLAQDAPLRTALAQAGLRWTRVRVAWDPLE